MKKTVFTGAGVALIAPMNKDFTVNYKEFGRLIDFQIENGTDALVISGTTGEAATLTLDEHIETIAFAVKHAAGRIPVVAGTGSNDTEFAVDISRRAVEAGADALLMVTPYYNKTSQTGLIKHYEYICDRVDAPVILYNVPSRTGVNIKPETYAELAKIPNIVGAKEASGDITSIFRTRSLVGDDFAIYSGNDDQIVPILSLGGKGVISVLSNVMPRETHDICRLYFEGKVRESAELQIKLCSLIDALFCDVNPIPVKEAMNMMGFDCGECRLPLYKLSDANRELLRKAMAEHGLIK